MKIPVGKGRWPNMSAFPTTLTKKIVSECKMGCFFQLVSFKLSYWGLVPTLGRLKNPIVLTLLRNRSFAHVRGVFVVFGGVNGGSGGPGVGFE